MEMTGEQQIPVSQDKTWQALNDLEVLKACIPGCESIVASGENEYDVVLTAKVGPVSAKFKGKLTLADLNPPHSYNLTFEGQGGVAGFARGNAQVNLMPAAEESTRRAPLMPGPAMITISPSPIPTAARVCPCSASIASQSVLAASPPSTRFPSR